MVCWQMLELRLAQMEGMLQQVQQHEQHQQQQLEYERENILQLKALLRQSQEVGACIVPSYVQCWMHSEVVCCQQLLPALLA
jgi:hypothetical protein